jgi:hypothetical protein
MGFKKPIDVVNIAQQINSASYASSSAYTDGFNAWAIKQDLYQLKEILDSAIRRCPDFGPIEQDWLKKQEQRKIIKILRDDQ